MPWPTDSPEAREPRLPANSGPKWPSGRPFWILRDQDNLFVIEPGVIRQTLLDMRIIMSDGMSLADTDLVFSRLNTDLVLSGRVLDYQDYQGPAGTPKVDFAAQITERKSREAVWTVKCYNQGDDGVYFFDWGRVNTAYAMADQMVQLAVAEMGE